jgi:hypothetical protein
VSDLGAWAPLRPEEVAILLADLDAFWCVAGGWAIDLVAGRQTRPHADTDVLVLLAPEQREWLDGALAVMDPGHPWRRALGIGG